jgi:hypothetical protein
MTETKWAQFWIGVRLWAFKYIGGLFMEQKDGQRVISIGRCMLLSILGWMFYFWANWQFQGSVTPEQVAQIVLDNLPLDTTINEYHIEFAARQIVSAIPQDVPPLLDTAFLTACAYVFGSKVSSVVADRLNR